MNLSWITSVAADIDLTFTETDSAETIISRQPEPVQTALRAGLQFLKDDYALGTVPQVSDLDNTQKDNTQKGTPFLNF